MQESVREFLTEIVDYAGLFPPAKLAMEPAIRNYARDQSQADAWMLGRFVCPAARLAELDPFMGLFSADSPLRISALGRGGNTPSEFEQNLDHDVEAMRAFVRAHADRVGFESFEVKPPAGCPGFALLQRGWSDGLRERCGDISVWFELGFAHGWQDPLDAMIGYSGLKVRCGGLEPGAIPSDQQIASAIAACCDSGVPMKCTAGLHHPNRRLDPAVGGRMHGFLNVFGAAVLAHAGKLAGEEIEEMISDGDASNFEFDDAGFGWTGLRASAAQIGAARRELITSFGSCSFDEPREDLRALGWLPEDEGFLSMNG